MRAILKENNKSNQGFTLIEVLISIVIVTIITIVSTNILQSSLSSRDATFKVLNQVQQFNLASTMMRRDLRQAINVPMRDFYGNNFNATFLSPQGSNQLMFTTFIQDEDLSVSNVRRIEYLYDENKFFRRQYYVDNPYLNEDYFQTDLYEEIDDFRVSFSNGNKWVNHWPIDPITERTIPTLVRIQFAKETKTFEWIISLNINNVYQQ